MSDSPASPIGRRQNSQRDVGGHAACIGAESGHLIHQCPQPARAAVAAAVRLELGPAAHLIGQGLTHRFDHAQPLGAEQDGQFGQSRLAQAGDPPHLGHRRRIVGRFDLAAPSPCQQPIEGRRTDEPSAGQPPWRPPPARSAARRIENQPLIGRSLEP